MVGTYAYYVLDFNSQIYTRIKNGAAEIINVVLRSDNGFRLYQNLEQRCDTMIELIHNRILYDKCKKYM